MEEININQEINDFYSEATEYKSPGIVEDIVDVTKNRNDFEPVANTVASVPQQPEPAQQVTDKEAVASAKVIIAMVNTGQCALLGKFAAKKFEKKFSETQIDIIDKVADKPEAELEPEELSLKKKFEKAVAKYEKLTASLPFKPSEKEEMKDILAEYCKITGTKLSPGMLLVGAFIETLGSRVIDVAFD